MLLLPMRRQLRVFSRTRRQFCSTVKSDTDLQREYEGIYPRFLSLLNLGEDKNQEHFEQLEEKKVLASGLLKFLTYADLQNPLLLKYNFDPVEFMEGAMEAFKMVHKAIGSVELTNFANGFVKQSDVQQMLQVLKHAPTPYNVMLIFSLDKRRL